MESIIFKDTDTIWKELRSTYSGSFKNLVYGNLPNEQLVLKTLNKIAVRIKDVEWDIAL